MTGGRFVSSRRMGAVGGTAALLLGLVAASPAIAAKPGGGGGGLSGTPTPIQIFGVWHCSDDACTWGAVRTVSEFDSKNHWLIDRGDGTGRPSVNLVILSFVEPLKLLNQTNDATTVNGVPTVNTSQFIIVRNTCA